MDDRGHDGPMAEAARSAARRARAQFADPEPSIGQRLGRIGVLGWIVTLPMLTGLFAGRWLDRRMQTGIFFSAPLLMAGAALGAWMAWRWMQRSL